ncbi:hypothetical protein JMJ77_0014234 [Colletotrichum scovillei]|uniref:Uncharacterized protein n=1 Tax=Colletotrichum scovillei TaxID=1209932 RepID=A0A9P7R4L1_9PEZI|nr:hypothetical protein JMJ77_0014234 [Colletotrichum scovillei]KAG7065758.1 hypothetical protein JMJ78_0012506 [Colletotrichum scovillei]KAG7068364.1 hypothetical protein JMJ76_0008054 [Colletotrichum scovillei]
MVFSGLDRSKVRCSIVPLPVLPSISPASHFPRLSAPRNWPMGKGTYLPEMHLMWPHLPHSPS